MTVIFVVTKNKYFNVIEETAQTMCMDFTNDIVWCIIDCLYQIVPDMCLCISMIDSGNKYTTCFSSVVMMNFKIHNLPSKVRSCNKQTARNVYMSMQQ